MSILSKNFPEVLDAANGVVCVCQADGDGPGDMCPVCRTEYDAWREQRDAEPFDPELDAVLEILPEGSGIQFHDDPPFGPPF